MGKCMSKRSNENVRPSNAQLPEVPSPTGSRGSGSFDSRLQIPYDRPNAEFISFKQWHRRMQMEHDARLGSSSSAPKFSIWECCNCLCAPCRYFESIDYNRKLCIYFLEFRTFKSWSTGLIIVAFFYVILLHWFGEDIQPGGTYFYLFVMFLLAFLTGNILFSYGIPGNIGQLVVGIIFANLPFYVDESKITIVMQYSEKFMLLIVIIRAALLVDFAQLYGQFSIITKLSLIPYSAEFASVLLFGHYLMKLPWAWSALQGVLLAPVSLSSTITILEHSKKFISSEPTKVPTIIIAASSFQKIITIYIYSLLMAILFSKGVFWISTWWSLVLVILTQLIGGVALGVILGCLAGMFPDRRSFTAPYGRIFFIGTGTAALIMTFFDLGMSGVGVLSSSTMIVIASNIWEELGWHESSNPVLYFYSVLYFFSQPIGVSLAGFSLKFGETPMKEVGLSIGINLLGTAVRELMCLAVLHSRSLKINKREKLYIIVCWLPKGAAEALLASVLVNFVNENFIHIQDSNYTLEELIEIAQIILRTTVFGMLLTTPTSSLLTMILSFLSKK